MTRRQLLALPIIGWIAKRCKKAGPFGGGSLTVGPGNGHSVLLREGMRVEWYNPDLSETASLVISAIDYTTKTVTFASPNLVPISEQTPPVSRETTYTLDL